MFITSKARFMLSSKYNSGSFCVQMIKTSVLGIFFLMLVFSNGYTQTTGFRNTSLQKLEKARTYFYEGSFLAAKPLLQELFKNSLSFDFSNEAYPHEEILYMLSVVHLLADETEGIYHAQNYFQKYPATLRYFRLAYETANYYFRQNEYASAIDYYQLADVSQLTNKEVALMKFRQAYSYFQQRMYSSAKPLFNTIRQLPASPHYADANYYYGYICYTEKSYKEALESFEKVKEHAVYSNAVPYYLASINYLLGQKDKAVAIAESALKKPNLQFRSETNLLLGHAYFERKDYKKSEPLLEAYYKETSKITREQLYELSYTYYKNEKLTLAADGLKQLSEGADSLSQDAMFLLGDIYLKTGDKTSARNAFAFCAGNSSNAWQREVSTFFYAKLSVDLGFQGVAITELNKFIKDYPKSEYNKEAKELLATLLGNTNNYKDAIALLESLDNLSENTKRLYPRLLYGRAVELLNDQQLLKAEILLEQVLDDPFGKEVYPFAHFWIGDMQYRSGKYTEALGHFQQFINAGVSIQGQPTTKEAYYQSGYCYYHLQRTEQALNAFQKVVDKPNANATLLEQDAYLRQADCHYLLRKYNPAQDMYQQVIDRLWINADYALFQKARIAGISKPEQKINLLLQMQKQFPSSSLITEADMEIADTYLSDEKFNLAIPYLQKVVLNKTSSLRAAALFRLGTTYYNLDKDADALNTLQLLLKDYPSSPESSDALSLIKTIFVEKGDPLAYETYLKNNGRSLSDLEADSLTYEAIQVKINNNDCKGVLELSAGYVKRFPNGIHSQEVRYQRSLCFQQAKDWNNALEGFESVVSGNASPIVENAALYGARIAYFELQAINRAVVLYEKLFSIAGTDDRKTEALRGALRCYYRLKEYESGQTAAQLLLNTKTAGNDDKALSHLVNGYVYQRKNMGDQAIQSYRQTIQINKGEWSAEARYQIAKIYFDKKDYTQSEKAAFEVIHKSGSYESWVARSYLLLGDIYFQQKDYFNAKATYQSVADNTSIEELRTEAREKLAKTIEAEKQGSKLNQ